MSAQLTRRIAEFIVETKSADIDPAAREAAIRPIVDTVGVVLAGASGTAGQAILDYARRIAGPGEHGRRWTGAPASLPPEIAAMVSGTLGHALDYDDELAGTGHPSAILASAILSLPVERLSGEAMIEAFVIGFEVNVKVANIVGHRHYRTGWHTTATVGGFGAVAAASRLLGLTTDQTQMALGVVASLSGGLQRNFGTMTKPLHSGLAARNGVVAAQLADVGFTASADVLDGGRGFVEIYGVGGEDLSAIDRLGRPWAILDPGVTLKKYPCCYATHRPIDGVLSLQRAHDLSPEDITVIDVKAPTFGLHPLIHHNPRTGLQGKFSLEYVLAAALTDRRVTLDSFTDEAVNRPEVRELMGRVVAVEDPRCRPEDPEAKNSSAGTGGFHVITLRTHSGEEFQTTVQYPSGSPYHPLSWSDIAAKFEECLTAAGCDPVAGTELFEQLKTLPEQGDVHALLASGVQRRS